MKNKFLIGLDGGGTKTKCVITDMEYKPLYECQGGPSNFLIIGTEKVSETILNLILECISKLNLSTEDIASIFIGTTGAGRVNDANKLKEDFSAFALSKGYSFNQFNVDSDARIALEGAFSGKSGSLLIAGTGSVIFGKDSKGTIHRVGGFGRLIGDEGSGNTIGRRGLNMASKDFDGRGEKTELTTLLKKHFGIADAQQLITEVYRNNFDMAAFAPYVIEAAKNGDSAATKILDEESDELVMHVKSIFNKIGEVTMKLCLVGGTITTDNYYSDLFRKKTQDELPEVKIVQSEYSPEIGAVIMSKSFYNSNPEIN